MVCVVLARTVAVLLYVLYMALTQDTLCLTKHRATFLSTTISFGSPYVLSLFSFCGWPLGAAAYHVADVTRATLTQAAVCNGKGSRPHFCFILHFHSLRVLF